MEEKVFLTLEGESLSTLNSSTVFFVIKFSRSTCFKIATLAQNSQDMCQTIHQNQVNQISQIQSNGKTVSSEEGNSHLTCFDLDLSLLQLQLMPAEEIPQGIQKCNLPSILDSSRQICYSGLCTVLRRIFLKTKTNLDILGFRQTNLKYCAAVSFWTKLCETSLPLNISSLISNNPDHKSAEIPESIQVLESSLSSPVSAFNIDRQNVLDRQYLERSEDGSCSKQSVGNYKTNMVVVNKKEYRQAIRDYKAAMRVGSIGKDVSFKKSQFYLPFESWQTNVVITNPSDDLNVKGQGQDESKAATNDHNETSEVAKTLRNLNIASDPVDGNLGQDVKLNHDLEHTDNENIPVHDSIISSVNKRFAVGFNMTLTDLALFVPVHVYLRYVSSMSKEDPDKFITETIPHVATWYNNMWDDEIARTAALEIGFSRVHISLPKEKCVMGAVERPKSIEGEFGKGKTRKAKHHAIRRKLPGVLEKLERTRMDLGCKEHPAIEMVLDWDHLPKALSPQHGEVPSDRLLKKHQQIESLVSAVKMMAKDGDCIVDFCSGGGHVGIVLAYLFPRCHIVMIENNEESLRRAWERVNILHLKNVTLYQCNIDYFTGNFDIGVSLHACGSATDIVIDKCLQQGASFVSSPCCYGSIQQNEVIHYPRSKLYSTIPVSLEEYLTVGHASEQTSWDFERHHSKQGKLCMTIVDTDRLSYVQEHGYNTLLCSLRPHTCSPKNNLLIAVSNARKDTVKFSK